MRRSVKAAADALLSLSTSGLEEELQQSAGAAAPPCRTTRSSPRPSSCHKVESETQIPAGDFVSSARASAQRGYDVMRDAVPVEGLGRLIAGVPATWIFFVRGGACGLGFVFGSYAFFVLVTWVRLAYGQEAPGLSTQPCGH